MQSPLAQLTIEWHEKVCLFLITGEIDRSNSVELSESISKTAAEAACAIINVSGLEYLDSAALTMVHELAEVTTRKLILVAPTGSRARRLLEIAGMDTILTIAETTEEALALA
jgi:anti-anti-sigma factor